MWQFQNSLMFHCKPGKEWFKSNTFHLRLQNLITLIQGYEVSSLYAKHMCLINTKERSGVYRARCTL